MGEISAPHTRARPQRLRAEAGFLPRPRPAAVQLRDRHRAAERRRSGSRSAGSTARALPTCACCSTTNAPPRTGASSSAAPTRRTSPATRPARATTSRRSTRLTKSLFTTFPQLEGLRIDHAWGGTMGFTMDFTPSVGVMGEHKNIYYGVAYNGEGVAFSQTAGRIIAELIAGEQSELTKLLRGEPRNAVSRPAHRAHRLRAALPAGTCPRRRRRRCGEIRLAVHKCLFRI